MDDLVTWLRAQLDEDEAVARGALVGPWHVDQRLLVDAPGLQVKNEAGLAVTWTPGFYERGPRDAAHIARHDPARTLREVEGWRRILARYEDCLQRLDDDDYSTADAALQIREYEDFVLPALALRYADRPGYREEWEPSA